MISLGGLHDYATSGRLNAPPISRFEDYLPLGITGQSGTSSFSAPFLPPPAATQAFSIASHRASRLYRRPRESRGVTPAMPGRGFDCYLLVGIKFIACITPTNSVDCHGSPAASN